VHWRGAWQLYERFEYQKILHHIQHSLTDAILRTI
jgi:hypothetical protein